MQTFQDNFRIASHITLWNANQTISKQIALEKLLEQSGCKQTVIGRENWVTCYTRNHNIVPDLKQCRTCSTLTYM